MDTHLTIPPKTTSAILSALIAQSNQSQKAIAKAAGVSASHLSRILHGAVNPTDRTFVKIIQATGAHPAIVGITLIVGLDHLPVVVQSDFVTRLFAELPIQLFERLGEDVIYADPKWASVIVNYIITKTEETIDRKRQADSTFKPDL